MAKEREICCDYFLKIAPMFRWFSLKLSGKPILVMPCVVGTEIRINYCPSCGGKVRDIELNPEQLKIEVCEK